MYFGVDTQKVTHQQSTLQKRGTFDEEKVNYYKWSYEKLTRAHIYILVLQVCTISLISEKCLYFFFRVLLSSILFTDYVGGQKFEKPFFVPIKKIQHLWNENQTQGWLNIYNRWISG